ncbi:lipopolysaccharide biosynthesis protein [Bradyrhizobium sp. CCBAU 45384]|uniref:lipopolysaccharide biosynthesis protein n=1 Tax=Bradyrhizobium sp. CCBAU 45384 TaxID=858428 RepID=UPI00230649EB|nr:lipopolysaccharide biosynthesis protein [Bradyrhizobium sp. CCBAU 45384]
MSDGVYQTQANVHEDAGPSPALRTKVASGVRWGLVVSILTQVGRVAFMLALMRLLGPRNFGIVGQAAVFIAIAQIFVHFGLAASIVQRPTLDHQEVGTAFWLNVAMGLILAAAMVLAAPLLASFFETHELAAVFRVLALSLVLKAMAIVPTALLTRNMRFAGIATAEITSTFTSGLIGVGAAAIGAGYWALVIQAVSLEALYLLMIVHLNGLPELTWSTRTARRLWSFSSRIVGADLVNYASGNFDKILIAKFLGATALGLYSLAFRVLQLTLGVMGQVGRVILPTFSRLQNDRERLTRTFLTVTESVSLAVFPTMTLTILIAPAGVPAVLGHAWAEAIVPVQLVAALTIPCVLVSYMGPLTVALGRADCEFYWSVVTLIAMLVAIPIGLLWGIIGVAGSFLIMLCALTAIRLAVVQRLIPITARGYLRALAPASACSVVLAIVWELTDALLKSMAGELTIAAAASAAGAAAYLITLRVAWPDDYRRQLEFARLILRGDRR